MIKPYYEHGGITIYHGDCREIVPLLAFGGLVLTDPPYGIAHPTDYAARGRDSLAPCRDYTPVHGDNAPFDPRWLLGVGAGRIIWGANHFAHLLPPVSGWLVWDKERPDDLDQATCELAWSDCVKGVRRYRHLWNGMIRAGNDTLAHPTQKPEAVMRWCLGMRWTVGYSDILDPYMGSGTTLVAAKDCGRFAVGIEIEERYCEIAARRLEQEVLEHLTRWSYSAAGFPARTSQTLASERGLTDHAQDSGVSLPEPFASYDPATSSWRTSQLSLDGDLSEYSETWPRSGTMRSGRCYQRPTLERPTSGRESGLWPTMTAADSHGHGWTQKNGKRQLTLVGTARLWPTPCARENGGCSLDGGSNSRKAAKARGMWPTPKTPTGGGQMERTTPGGGIRKLEDAVSQEVGYPTGALNPTWVEWLMGFPGGWTALEDSATPSSRNAPAKSSKPSKRGKAR